MTLQQLTYFMEIARTGSYTAAAQNLFISQSSISYSIQELERELGVSLFERSAGKKVRLTSYGATFLPNVEKSFEILDSGKSELAKMSSGRKGEPIRIGFTYYTSIHVFSEIQKAFSKTPNSQKVDIHYTLNRAGQDFFSDSLLNGKCDLCITCLPPQQKIDGFKIAEQELVVLLPIDHPLADRSSLSILDIAHEPFISYIENNAIMRYINPMFEEARITPRILATLTTHGDWFDHLVLVTQKHGITIVPPMAAKSRDPSAVAAVPLNDSRCFRDIYLVWQKNRKMPLAMEQFIRFCQTLTKDEPIMDTL